MIFLYFFICSSWVKMWEHLKNKLFHVTRLGMIQAVCMHSLPPAPTLDPRVYFVIKQKGFCNICFGLNRHHLCILRKTLQRNFQSLTKNIQVVGGTKLNRSSLFTSKGSQMYKISFSLSGAHSYFSMWLENWWKVS